MILQLGAHTSGPVSLGPASTEAEPGAFRPRPSKGAEHPAQSSTSGLQRGWGSKGRSSDRGGAETARRGGAIFPGASHPANERAGARQPRLWI